MADVQICILVSLVIEHVDCLLELFIRHPENNIPGNYPHTTGGKSWSNILVIESRNILWDSPL